ncbi:MAG TPA: MscL family protein [Gemmatimonadaceae bacterium]|nr:MscL family protein [Gemmatimonadaceae bacterium]
MWKDFKEFLIKQNAIALAIAVVIGAALNTVVQAIVNDIVLPLVQLVSPSVKWQDWNLGNFKFGDLASAVLNFFIVGFVAWRISKIFVKEPPKGPPTTKACGFCKMTVDIGATRCPHCTSQLAG